MSFSLTSAAFEDEGDIPPEYTCDGSDTSPALFWTAPPPGTRSMALIVDDPDAPDPAAPQRVWTHWVLYNIPPDAGSLPRGTGPRDLPDGTREGLNDWQRTGYGGPCPPTGRHRYFHRLYALDTVLPDLGTVGRKELERAMQGHVIGQAQLMGLYERG